ncbi:hypothetical protein [Chromobacterium violaceum]|uniref:hypothetical protein n=1 Tax=Chromobacterium violaceum TaxID=536 RepID=UPI003DA9B0F9
MKEFDNDDVRTCAYSLTQSVNSADAAESWLHLKGKFPNLCAMVSLTDYERCSVPPSVKKYTKEPNNYLVPYLTNENIYFLDDELLASSLFGKVKFPIDYSLMFDTNVATYIDKLVHGEKLGGDVQQKLIPLIDNILHDDLNFDFLFYLTENVKNILNLLKDEQGSKFYFWKSLDRKFRRNMFSLQLFRSIDTSEYKRTSNPKFRFTPLQAAREAVDLCYGFYATPEAKKKILNFIDLQRTILLQVIEMTKIQLSSNRSAKNKFKDFLFFMHNDIGLYFDREAIVAHKYFLDRKNFEMLEKIKTGSKRTRTRLLKKLDNIAWDMAASRFMENVTVSGEGRYFIPMFLTFDSRLRQLFTLYPVKVVMINKESKKSVSLPEINTADYFEQYDLKNELEEFFCDSAKMERRKKRRLTRQDTHQLIKKKHKELRDVLIAAEPKEGKTGLSA